MRTYSFKGKTYQVDTENFLIDKDAWDKGFAEGMALELGIKDGLGQRHWEVIDFIRNRFLEAGVCPVVHETTRALGMNLKELQALFPTGYHRGACLLAGITYKYGWVYYFDEPYPVSSLPEGKEDTWNIKPEYKIYRVDLFGYLVNPTEWDVNFAARRAYEMNMQDGLTQKHWQVIKYLRDSYQQSGKIPTIFDCCESNRIDIEKFADLFPTAYHRGAVKIAGLPAIRNTEQTVA